MHTILYRIDWSAIGSMLSGIGTIALVIFALYGLNSWKKEHQLKLKLSYLDELEKTLIEHEDNISLASLSFGIFVKSLKLHIPDIQEIAKDGLINDTKKQLEKAKNSYARLSALSSKAFIHNLDENHSIQTENKKIISHYRKIQITIFSLQNFRPTELAKTISDITKMDPDQFHQNYLQAKNNLSKAIKNEYKSTLSH